MLTSKSSTCTDQLTWLVSDRELANESLFVMQDLSKYRKMSMYKRFRGINISDFCFRSKVQRTAILGSRTKLIFLLFLILLKLKH